jgi:RNA polymerase sigma-70 factor (sigma-E family)
MIERRSRAEFTEFAQARSPSLQRAAYLMVGDVPLAQDLVQEALIKTYMAWPRLRDIGNAEAYARKAITTTAISWFRRKAWASERSVAELPEPWASQRTTDHAGRVDDQALLRDCLQGLPARQRAAVTLRFYVDLTEAQTAEAMGCSVGAVKSQVHAALAKLRARMGADLELDSLSKVMNR